MSENELKPCDCDISAVIHLDCPTRKEIDHLTQLLAKERDEFGKKEITLIQERNEAREMLEKHWAERDPAILREAKRISDLEARNKKLETKIFLIEEENHVLQQEIARRS